MPGKKYLLRGEKTVVNEKDIADTLASHYERVSTVRFESSDAAVRKESIRCLRRERMWLRGGKLCNLPTEWCEWQQAVSELEKGKTPGEDGIGVSWLQKGREAQLRWLWHIVNTSFIVGRLPKEWKRAEIRGTPKKAGIVLRRF